MATVAGTTGDDELLGHLDDGIALWSRKAKRDPNDYISATNLAALDLQRAKIHGDAEDYARAQAAVARAIDADPTYQHARLLDGSIRFAIHDFSGALSVSRQILADDATSLDARALGADAQLELGDLTGAAATYRALAAKVSGPPIDLRLARLAQVTGNPARAVELARKARDAAASASAPDLGIYDVALAEIARQAGDAPTAREAFTSALALRPGDLGGLVGLAKIEAAAGETSAAIGHLHRAADIAPQPETLALLGDLDVATGDAKAGAAAYRTVRAIRRIAGTAASAYDRILLRFELDHGGATEAVLSETRASLAARPDAGGHDLAAWALHRLGRDDEAAVEIEAAQASGIVDARILFHAGAIALARGDRANGTLMLDRALALGPAIDPIERAEDERLRTG